MSRLTDRDRLAVYDRDGNACVKCGTNWSLSIQHRANRQMGGDRTARKGLRGVKDNFANLLTMCWPHNAALESDSKLRDEAIEFGWKLSQADTPREVPVFYPMFGQWRLLENDLTYVIVDGPYDTNTLDGMVF